MIIKQDQERKQELNEELAQELHKSVIKKFKRRKVYSRFKDNILAADLAQMGSLSSKNRGDKHLLCVIDIFTQYSWIIPSQNKKAKTVLQVNTSK